MPWLKNFQTVVVGPLNVAVSGFFLELASCIRFRVEEPPDERPQTRFTNIYSAHSLVLSVENRDSMALLAAIFTGMTKQKL